MVSEKHYLALDLGAESGRGILGTLSNGRIELSEVHRFQTGPESLPTKYPNTKNDTSLVWDFVRFWREVKKSIQIASKKVKIESIGADTWGVDFALLDKNGQLLSYPYHYRDSRTNGMMEEAFKCMPKEKIYEITGIQFMQLNTLFQLFSLSFNKSPLLKIADKMLMVPDLINYWLTGLVASEFSEATTSQLFDPHTGSWSHEIISAMGIPAHLFPKIIMNGKILGPLRQSVSEELGCEAMVVAPPTHDTASAVAAVPAENENFIWISSGTWSIIGMNFPAPIINEQCYQHNLTNEGGFGGSYCFSKNVMGLWIVQQCRQYWQREGKDYSYTELTEMARDAAPFETLIDPDYSEFLQMGNMIEKVSRYCQITQQPFPASEGALIRAALQGLALRYRFIIEQLEEISGKKTSTIHIVGGGTKNRLLNQFTADATGRKVITGPIEATATGNLIVQALSMGDIANWQEGSAIIRNSFDIETYTPGNQTPWNAAFEKFKENLKKIPLAF